MKVSKLESIILPGFTSLVIWGYRKNSESSEGDRLQCSASVNVEVSKRLEPGEIAYNRA